MPEQRTPYEIVESVLTELSPEEVRHLPELWEIYLRDPRELERSSEQLLGSGVLAELAAWGPLVVTFVGGALLEAVREEITERARGVFGFAARRRAAAQAVEEPLRAFDPVQRRRIGAAVLSRARAFGMPEERAQLLADAVVGELQRLADATAQDVDP
ncbi:hypothetical protein [Nonomuraea sp. LPB2021202275-12-8]|uniref:hypothetical protein n=1 Tax=Nonomuraea sp. LPB2021202275-12-8 TaxID=3120159 RepID=UPI00300C00FD